MATSTSEGGGGRPGRRRSRGAWERNPAGARAAAGPAARYAARNRAGAGVPARAVSVEFRVPRSAALAVAALRDAVARGPADYAVAAGLLHAQWHDPVTGASGSSRCDVRVFADSFCIVVQTRRGEVMTGDFSVDGLLSQFKEPGGPGGEGAETAPAT